MCVLHDVCKAFGGTCGSVLWTASTALIEWLDADPSRREHITKRTVVELGSGLGFTGTCLLRMGAAQVLLTDVPRQLPILRRNLRSNRRPSDGATLQSCGFVWGGRPRRVFLQRWDLVVACDVVYKIDHVPALADTIASLLESGMADAGCSPGGTQALLALPDRKDFGYHLKVPFGPLFSPTSHPALHVVMQFVHTYVVVLSAS